VATIKLSSRFLFFILAHIQLKHQHLRLLIQVKMAMYFLGGVDTGKDIDIIE